MYNLLVSSDNEAWNGDPFILDLGRCIREYTDKKITEKYGDLSQTQIDEIVRFPCIFAYESRCEKDPRFGLIRKIVKRQNQVKISYEIIEINNFLTHSNLSEMLFELDILDWEMSRTHWAIKDVNLAKELTVKDIQIPQLINNDPKAVDITKYHFDVSLSLPSETKNDVEPTIATLESEKKGKSSMSTRQPIKIFFCYAHEDKAFLKQLQAHLRPLQREGLIDAWYDHDISAGLEWEREISKHLNTAQIILLLVSPDFMDSEYCYSIEMKRALERHERGEAHVIPVILRHTYWRQGILGKLQALPVDAKPVKSWQDQDEAFFNVVENIHHVVEEISKQPEQQQLSPIEQIKERTTESTIERAINNQDKSADIQALKDQFHQAMIDTYREAAKIGYNANPVLPYGKRKWGSRNRTPTISKRTD